jgi:hypothetical protein
VTNSTDNLVLEKVGGKYREAGSYLTELLTLPPDCFFDLLAYEATVPTGTKLRVNILDKDNNPLHTDVANGAKLHIGQPARLEFLFSTMNPAAVTPLLDSYSLSFSR